MSKLRTLLIAIWWNLHNLFLRRKIIMTADLKSLFHGIAIVIDDKVGVEEDTPDPINQIVAVIESQNCHAVKLRKIPSKEQAKNFTGASFFILDWEFNPLTKEEISEGVQVPANLKNRKIKENLNFIEQINESQFIPIFIFTSEDTNSVKQELQAKGLLMGTQGDHIYVLSKSDVLSAGLFETMETWIRTHPSAYVFKKWESAYSTAKDSLFKEFYKSSRFWPTIIWKTHNNDNTLPEVEMGKLITRNIESRTSPIEFDESILNPDAHDIAETPKSEIKKVLAGERVVQDKFLSSKHLTTGDIFKYQGKFFINIRPECDCISRDGNIPDLYLLRGDLKDDAWIKEQNIINIHTAELHEKHTEALIFSAYDEKTLRFFFKEVIIVSQDQIKSYKRIGRLIPPFLTRLLQRYAAYCNRPGIPRIPDELLPKN